MSMIFFSFKLIICNIDIHTCLLDSTFRCPHLLIKNKCVNRKLEKGGGGGVVSP